MREIGNKCQSEVEKNVLNLKLLYRVFSVLSYSDFFFYFTGPGLMQLTASNEYS